MKTFRSAACLERVRGDPFHDTLRELLLPIVCPHAHRDYCPEEDGYLIQIEPGDVDRVLDDLGVPYRLSEMPFEVLTTTNIFRDLGNPWERPGDKRSLGLWGMAVSPFFLPA